MKQTHCQHVALEKYTDSREVYEVKYHIKYVNLRKIRNIRIPGAQQEARSRVPFASISRNWSIQSARSGSNFISGLAAGITYTRSIASKKAMVGVSLVIGSKLLAPHHWGVGYLDDKAGCVASTRLL